MKRQVAAGIGASCLVLAGCAEVMRNHDRTRVLFEDNVGGMSAARISSSGAAVQVHVAEYADQCRLQQFQVGPRPGEQRGVEVLGAEPLAARLPDEVRAGEAMINVFSPGSWIVRAQYGHTALAEEGEQAEPDWEPREAGEGELQVGRALGGGYRFDHVEFRSQVQGPGGASARVSRYPAPNAQNAAMTIHWSYDKYSSVRFHWKIYARGPCDTKP